MLCSFTVSFAQTDDTASTVLTDIDFSSSSEDISGLIKFWEIPSDPVKYKAEILIYNSSGQTLDFRGAIYSAIDGINAVYSMPFDEIGYNDSGISNPALNPEDTIQIFCYMPGDPREMGIERITIKLPIGISINFYPNPKLIKVK